MNNEEKITRYLGKIAANTERIAKALEERSNPNQRRNVKETTKRCLPTKEEYADEIKGWIKSIEAKMADKDPDNKLASEIIIENLRYSLDHIDEKYEEYMEQRKRLASPLQVSDDVIKEVFGGK